MECLLGLCFKDFAIIASDQTSARSILVMKEDYDKTLKLSDNLLLGVCGESGDTSQFADFIEKSVQLYKIQNGYELSPHAAANFTRRNLADYLRSRTPFSVNLLIAGYDKGTDECKFYALDYLGSKVETKFSAHGYGGFFSLALMDQKYRDDMTKDEAYELIKDCVYEIQKRLIVNMPRFQVKVVEKSGITKLPDITIQARA